MQPLKEITYPAIFYFDRHPTNKRKYEVSVVFPDLIKTEFTATTVGKNLSDAKKSAENVLKMIFEESYKKKVELPLPPTPIVEIRPNEYYVAYDIFRIIIDNVTIYYR
ncbi:hypothetical protein ACQKML_24075 [Peribacillus frigoritolerans]